MAQAWELERDKFRLQDKLSAIRKLRDEYDFDDVRGIDSFTTDEYVPAHIVDNFLEELDRILEESRQ